MWFLPKRKLKIHVFCKPSYSIRHQAVKRAAAFVPAWWKKLAPTVPVPDHPLLTQATMKSCVGFTNLYRHGFIVPMWCDLRVMVGKLGTTGYLYQYSDRRSTAKYHDAEQRTGFVDDTEYQHLKLESPWNCYCDEDIEFLLMSPTWNLINYKTVTVLPGVYKLKIMGSTNINLMIKRTEEDQTIEFPSGTPMAHFIPLTNKKIELVYHFEDATDRYNVDTMYREKFSKTYDHFDKAKDFKEMACPITGKGSK